jgi:4-diphosphocytidyl-2-C-methyl-D-erythritol kinase
MIYKKSPAKINLFLKVLNTRDDGFHDLSSLMILINIFDEISVEKSDKFSLEISGEFANLINIKNNLFITILNYFQQHFAISYNLKIKLIKNIPVGAGLGGGSSNACQFMIILNEIFNLNLSKSQLQKISFNFGCDIAFFFENSPQIIAKKGNELIKYPQKISQLLGILIYPQINLSTKEVFKKFDLEKKIFDQNQNLNNSIFSNNSAIDLLENQISNLSINQILELPNDLENPAFKIAPIISEIKNNLNLNGAKISKMSGSGSSVFGIFDDQNSLQIAYENLKKIYPDFFVKQFSLIAEEVENILPSCTTWGK